jgi:hypothetical protein
MALENVIVITSFPDNASVWILAFVYDVDGTLADPTAIKVSVIDPDGETQVEDASMTKYDSNTGIYEYTYHKGVDTDPMDEGEWRIEGEVIDGTGESAIISPFNGSFTVK